MTLARGCACFGNSAIALQSPDEFEQFARTVPAPLLANMTGFGKTPYLTVNEFAQLGYKMVIFPMSCFRAMMKAAEQTLLCIKQYGTQTPMLDAMQTRAELYELLEYDRYLRYDQQLAQE